MFDWNEDEEVRNTIWGDFTATEDHIVPYPEGSEDNNLVTFGDYCKKQRHEQTSTDVSTTEQRASEAKNDLPCPNIGSTSHFRTTEELSAQRFDMDPWPDLPSLNSALSKGYTGGNHHNSLPSKLIDEFVKAPNLHPGTDNMVTEFCHTDGVLHNKDSCFLKESCGFSDAGMMQLDSGDDMFDNGFGNKEGDTFLDCYWSNISDFDDLDRIFRNNESIFGHEMIGNADELLSPSIDAISTTTTSFVLPNIPPSRDGPVEKDSTSIQVDEQSGGVKKPLKEYKMADKAVAAGEQSGSESKLTNENCGIHQHLSNKVGRQNKLPKSRKKVEEMSKMKSPQNLRNSWPQNINRIQHIENLEVQAPLKFPLQSFPSGVHCQQREVGGPGYMGLFHGSNQHMLTAYGYPAQPFPAMSLLSPAHAERRLQEPVLANHTIYPDSLKDTSSVQTLPEVQSRSLTMTPQEKIEKLRRRQKMQAMLAIHQQQQRFGSQSTCTDKSVSQTCSQMNQSQDAAVSSVRADDGTKWFSSSEMNMPVEQDGSHKISLLIDDSLGETIFYQLQDAIGKLDASVQLCIRDSLFRLARSALERQNASDRSSSNRSKDDDEILANDETNSQDRSTRLPSETDTNPVDRIVAHLLFYKPSESCVQPPKDETPQSPNSNDLFKEYSSSKAGVPDSKQSNACESLSEDKPEITEETRNYGRNGDAGITVK